MAIFDTLRKRSGVVIVAIGVALGAFILGEFISSATFLFGDDQDAIGYIDGEKVSYTEFNQQIENLRKNNPNAADVNVMQLADEIWRQELEKHLIGKRLEDLGFMVSEEEVWTALGNDPSIRPMFTDPNTGVFDAETFRNQVSLLESNKDVDEEAKKQWESWEAFRLEVEKRTLYGKYYAAIEKGIRTPKALFQHEMNRRNRQVEVEWAGISVNDVPDDAVSVTDANFRAVYEDNKENFKVYEEVRDMVFANFPIVPSSEDKAKVRVALNELRESFAAAENDTDFVLTHSDPDYVNPGTFVSVDMLEAELAMAFEGQEAGFVTEPLQYEPRIHIYKLLERRNLPDSVSARHILISFAGAERSQATRDPYTARQRAQNVLDAINSGEVSFEELASNDTLNDDIAAASKGGDLGWFKQNMMARPFQDYCFQEEKGSTGLVLTDFGFHIINITGQAGSVPSIKVAEIAQRVYPSEETEQAIYTRAAEFAAAMEQSDNAQAVANEFGVALLPNKNTTSTDYQIVGIGPCREVVKWVFSEERSLNEIGVINNDYQSYVVTRLNAIYQPGYKPMNDVRDELEMLAMNHAKVEYLVKNWASQAPTYQTATVSASNLMLPGVGREAQVVGSMLGSAVDFNSEIVAGLNGAYQFKVLKIVDNPSPFADSDLQDQNNLMRGRVQTGLLQALMEAAEIKDYRGKFY